MDLNEKIATLNHRLMTTDLAKLPIGLFYGKMGICIYFFNAAKQTDNKEYRQFAEKLLDEVYEKINEIQSIDLDTGLVGVAWGINYLIRNEFVSGNPDVVLKNIDDQLFKTLNFVWLEDQKRKRIEYLKILFYCAIRLETCRNKQEKVLMQDLVIKILNHIEHGWLPKSDWTQPVNFWIEYELAMYLLITSRLYEQGFYNYKIMKIWDELTDTVLFSLPVQHVNRVYLLLGIKSVLYCAPRPAWEQHANLLQQNIDKERILHHDFRNKNINIRNGVAGYGIVLNMLSRYMPIEDFGTKEEIRQKIALSNCWAEEFNPESEKLLENVGLYSGFAGVIPFTI